MTSCAQEPEEAELAEPDPAVEIDEEAEAAASAVGNARKRRRAPSKDKNHADQSRGIIGSFHPVCFCLGIIGAVFPGVGVFLPVIDVPVLHNVSLFETHFRYALAILCSAVAASIAAALGRYSLLVIPGVLPPALLMLTARQLKSGTGGIYDLYTKTVMKSDVQASLVIVYEDVRMKWWGWVVMGAGIVALIAASVIGSRIAANERKLP